MNKLFIIFLITSLLQSCNSKSERTTELEGTWVGLCRNLSISNTTNSFNKSITFKSNTAVNGTSFFTDDSCNSMLSSSQLEELLLSAPEIIVSPIIYTYKIGDSITTSNGVVVNELNYFDPNNVLTPDIYLIQNAGTTLLLGERERCKTETCSFVKPTELDYVHYNTKQI